MNKNILLSLSAIYRKPPENFINLFGGFGINSLNDGDYYVEKDNKLLIENI